ncbi:acyl-CoA N-acyltransferase [Mycena vitilis]|nr:acyl-CoA N-acyltransferase [Mycena vitilis]
MIPSQFLPLERNQETGELFLRLPSPHQTIILTPLRASDSAAIADIVNDPAVHPWLGRPNATFLVEGAQKLVEEFILASDTVSRSLEDANSVTSVLVPAEDCPADGTDAVYLGNIGFKRYNWWEVQAPERDRLIAENSSRQPEDPEIVWQVSDFLASSHHRRGIMTVALATLLEKWAIPRMRVHHIHISVFMSNSGSIRVFEKNGFVRVDTLENCIEIRCEKRSLHVLDWKH